EGNPVTLQVPDVAGEYEVRYVTGSDYITLASVPLTAERATATVSGPASADALAFVEVSWTGPGNRGDFITIVPAGDPDDTWGAYYAYVQDGDPVQLQVPDEPGDYEIRYVTGQSYFTLARQAITVR